MTRWLALVFALWLACGPSRDIEREAGWQGVALGTPIPSIEGLTAVGGGDEAVYTRAGDPKSWGKARIAVRYHGFEGVLWKVEIRTGDSMALLDAIKAEYGTPPFSKPWTWEGERVRMHFQGHEYDSAAEVTIVDKALEKRREAARKATPPTGG